MSDKSYAAAAGVLAKNAELSTELEAVKRERDELARKLAEAQEELTTLRGINNRKKSDRR